MRGYSELGAECIDHWPQDIHFTKAVYQSMPLAVKLMIRRTTFNAKSRTKTFALEVLKARIQQYQPDVIICHEHSKVPSEFFNQFTCIKINRISSPIPNYWNPKYFDGVITDIPSYVNFLEANNTPTLTITNPFGGMISSIPKSIKRENKICFIGSAGGHQYKERTAMLEEVAAHFPSKFSWYGQSFSEVSEALQNAHSGPLTGMEMYEQYFKTTIVVNDYISVANGAGVNQRIYESLGCGCHLFTRESEVLSKNIPKHLYSTFNNTQQLLQQLEEALGKNLKTNTAAIDYINQNHHFNKACEQIISFAQSLR